MINDECKAIHRSLRFKSLRKTVQNSFADIHLRVADNLHFIAKVLGNNGKDVALST
jgi:hypothetical protein